MKTKKSLTSSLISLSFTNLPSTVEIACTDTEKTENNDDFVFFKHRREKRDSNDNFVFFMQQKLGRTIYTTTWIPQTNCAMKFKFYIPVCVCVCIKALQILHGSVVLHKLPQTQ